MKPCAQQCLKNNSSCNEKECKYWIDFKEDNNCSSISINKHGALTFKQIGERLGLSITKIRQIQNNALKKIKDNIL